MFHLITGGSGSGKSEYAERMAVKYAAHSDGEERTELYYIATMMPFDEETKEKIKRHRRLRAGKGFQTVECYQSLKSGAEWMFEEDEARVKGPSVLLECMSNLAANELFSGQDFIEKQVIGSIMEGIDFLKENCANLVVVTNEVFSECAQDSCEMRTYKRILGKVNRMMARSADRVTEVVYGIPIDVGNKIREGAESNVAESGGEGNDGTESDAVEKGTAEGDGAGSWGERTMRMIIGGADQGKLDYAKALYPEVEWSDGRSCGREALYQSEGIYHFEAYVARLLKGELGNGEVQEKLPSAEEFCQNIVRQNPGLVIVTDEIGYGLVPIDAFERRYREETGRICTRLAACSSRVDRVICGIGTVIKGGEKTDEDRA